MIDEERTPVESLTPESVWEEIMDLRRERHAHQRKLEDLRERVARLEGSTISGEHTRLPRGKE